MVVKGITLTLQCKEEVIALKVTKYVNLPDHKRVEGRRKKKNKRH
jgi:hypothetical protein